MLNFEGTHAADARANTHANGLVIAFVNGQTGIVNGQLGGRDGELQHTIHALGFLFVHIVVRIKVVDFGRDLSGQVAGIKGSDAANAILTVQEGLPEISYANADRTQTADAGDDDSRGSTHTDSWG